MAVSECAGSNDLSSLKTETSAAAGQGERGMAASRSLVESLPWSAPLLFDSTGEHTKDAVLGGFIVSEL